MALVKKTLPYPPTVNHYYARQKNGATYVGQEGKSYRSAVAYCFIKSTKLKGKLRVNIDVYPPDKRRRDLDNLNKCLLDSLQCAGIIKDDFDIDELSMKRKEVTKPGKVIITIEEIKKIDNNTIGEHYDFEK